MRNCLIMVIVLFIFSWTLAYGGINPDTLSWTTCGYCPEAPDVNANGSIVSVGIEGRSEWDSQNNSRHIASAEIPPAGTYTITFSYDLATWDSYNAIGTPNPPFNGGTGFWDSFSISISDKPYWQLPLTDPLTTTQIPGLGFLWGGSSYGDLSIETISGTKTISLKGNLNAPNYLNVGLDTATFPHSNHAYSSWGKFTILEIKPNCDSEISLDVPLYKQCSSVAPNNWGSDPYDHINTTICGKGCALSSVAMVLSYHGIPTNPRLLNDWLKKQFNDKNKNGELDPNEETYGYTRSGDINWIQSAAYSGGSVAFKGFGSTFDMLNAELCNNRPVILQVPGHFIVATGKTANSYNINDPGYNRTTLDDPAYGGKFISMRKYGPPGSGAILIYASDAVHLLITDPLGRKLGYDNGSFVNEIIGASYHDESINDLADALNFSPVSHVLFIPNPAEGVYNTKITGITTASGIIDIYRYNNQDIPQIRQTIETNLSSGQTITEIITYSTRPGDLNSDGYVNSDDLNIIVSSFGASIGGPGYNPVADTNGDGIININDISPSFSNDLDGDGISDSSDNCPSTPNPDQLDINNNGIGDACDNKPPVVLCEDVILSADATCKGNTSINNGSYDPDGDPIAIIQSPAGPYNLGTTNVTLTVTDDKGASASCIAIVTVQDTTLPSISLSATPNTLWPPNHKMSLITSTITASDNCDLSPIIKLKSISMNEGDETNAYDPNYDSTTGDGHTIDDMNVDASGNIYLRAERQGTGSGRIYTIIYSATDASGNSNTASATVTVPHNQ